MTTVVSFGDLADALAEPSKQHVLLGNGFSMAYDGDLFGYTALAERAHAHELVSRPTAQLMHALGTPDFEATMRTLLSAVRALSAVDDAQHASTINMLSAMVDELREALARSIAGLHPERPYEISDDQYRSVKRFLAPFDHIYTVNYDLLLYWALMSDVADDGEPLPVRKSDDGFRDSGESGDTTVLWDVYDTYKQSVYYLHGALHLFIGDDGLRKLTWVRTDVALIDQVREQLENLRYPLYVAEADSTAKMDRIHRSAYLSRGLRSLSSVSGSLVIYGHSLDPNDDHVLEAIVRSRISHVAVSIYGDPGSAINQEIIRRVRDLETRCAAVRSAPTISFYDAESVALWSN